MPRAIFSKPRDPNPTDPEIVDTATHLATIALERDRVEQSLRRTQAQFRAIFDDTPLGIYLIDSEFRIREVNPTAQLVFGDIPDLIGRDFDKVIHILWPKAYADEIVERFRHTLDTGEP